MSCAGSTNSPFPKYNTCMKKIRSKYRNPWTTELEWDTIYGIADLGAVQAGEKEDLNVDPVPFDVWIITRTGKIFPNHEILSALKEIQYFPADEKSAIPAARLILENLYSGINIVLQDFTTNMDIPKEFYNAIKLPAVIKTDGSYIITVFASHSFPPRTFGQAPVEWHLYTYTITIKQSDYKISVSDILMRAENFDIIKKELETIIINNIYTGKMIKSFEEYLNKLELFKLSDQDNTRITEEQKNELDKEWDRSFSLYRNDIETRYRKILKADPAFAVDTEKIIKIAEYYKEVTSIENWDSKIRLILDKIREYCLLSL
ncbi:MAG: hypothetical protein JXJ04_10115 [Spirochaetales bacterium]|nr:hypothetical protein [Spirochaetales bacterium]